MSQESEDSLKVAAKSCSCQLQPSLEEQAWATPACLSEATDPCSLGIRHPCQAGPCCVCVDNSRPVAKLRQAKSAPVKGTSGILWNVALLP